MNLNRDDKVEIGTRNGKTNLMVNSERLVEAERWVPADVRTALNAYAKLHADILSETDGPTGLQYRNMFKDEKVFDTVFKGTGVTFKGVQGTLVEGCESYIGKSDYGLPFFQFHVEKEYYVGQGKNLECSPRWSHLAKRCRRRGTHGATTSELRDLDARQGHQRSVHLQ